MTTKYSFNKEVYEKEVDPYTIGFNEGYRVGFSAGLEAAKQAIVLVIENENKSQSNHEESR